MEQISFEELKQGMPGITPVIGEYLYENILAGMHLCQHDSGVSLDVQGVTNCQYSLNWDGAFTDQMQRAYSDANKVTEEASVGLSLLLTRKLTDYTVIERSWSGTGIDYWLGYEADPLFTRAARLEVSGILMETSSNSMASRIKLKEQQTKQSDATLLPAYISVVELSSPKAYFNRR